MSKSANAKLKGIEKKQKRKEEKNKKRFANKKRGEPGTARLKELNKRKEEKIIIPEPKKGGLVDKIKSLWKKK